MTARKQRNVPYFDTDEFCRLLTIDIGDENLAKQMMVLHARYEYCHGLVRGNIWWNFFDTRAQFREFKQKHGIERSLFVYPEVAEKIFIDELGVTRETAHKFTLCEERYMVHIGAM